MKVSASKRLRQHEQGPPEQLQFLSARDVSALLGVSAVTIWRMRRRGQFPAPIHISPGRIAWSSRDIDAWVETRRRAVPQ